MQKPGTECWPYIRTFFAPEAPGEWQNVRVPHHWRAEPAFAHSDGPLENAADWSGKISKLTGPNLGTYQDLVVGLPRGIAIVRGGS